MPPRLGTLVLVCLLSAAVQADRAQATMVTFYTDQAAFEAAVTSSSTIGFEGLVADNSYFTQDTPLTVDNVEFSVSSGFIGVAGPDVPDSQVVGAPFNSALLFSNNSFPITAALTGAGAGFTAAGGIFGNVSAAGRTGTLTLMGTGGLLDTRDVVLGDMGLGSPGTFFGWTVQGDSIVSVTYSMPNLHPHYEALDNFVYGFAAPTAAVPAPASFLLAMIGAVVVPLGLRRRDGGAERAGQIPACPRRCWSCWKSRSHPSAASARCCRGHACSRS